MIQSIASITTHLDLIDVALQDHGFRHAAQTLAEELILEGCTVDEGVLTRNRDAEVSRSTQ